jgi:uncharacterized RDD family membrane protein YckC
MSDPQLPEPAPPALPPSRPPQWGAPPPANPAPAWSAPTWNAPPPTAPSAPVEPPPPGAMPPPGIQPPQPPPPGGWGTPGSGPWGTAPGAQPAAVAYRYGGGLPGPDLASPGARIGARIIDSVIQMALVVPVVILWIASASTTSPESDVGVFIGLGGSILVTVLGLALWALYEIAFTAVKGATPGKMALRIRVVRVADGQVPGWGTASLRWLPNLGQLLCSLIPLALAVWALVNLFANPLRQTPFDLAAKTVVVNV